MVSTIDALSLTVGIAGALLALGGALSSDPPAIVAGLAAAAMGVGFFLAGIGHSER